MADSGFIKLHRKIIEWEWYDDINTTRLFLHLLLTVNYDDKKWHGIDVKKGEIITSLSKLSYETGLSVKQIRVSLNRLKTTHEVASRTTSTYSHIQLINWESYQSKGQASGHTEGNRRATTKESKEIKNKENNTTGTPPEIKKDFFSIELERVSDTGLKNALTEWWHYKKGKYQEVGWQKQVTICLGYPADIVIKRIDTAIASGWMGLNLEHLPKTQPTSSLTLKDL